MKGIFVLPVLISSWAFAAEPTHQCPERIEVKPQAIAKAVTGWNSTTDETPHSLAGVTFFDGDPSEHASLAPDNETPKNGKLIWTLGPSKAGSFMSCAYSGTTVTVYRKLPETTHTCEIRYDTKRLAQNDFVVKSVQCK